MAAAKKKTKVANAEAPETGAVAAENTAVEPVATKKGVPTYRTDMGESLPPQKYAGVE